MAVSGADPDQLRATARRFQGAADRLQGSVRTLTAITGNAAIWRGADADRFRSEWNSQSVRALNNAVQALRQGADALRRNAEEQDTASRADGGGTPGSTGAWVAVPTDDYGPAAQKTNDMYKQVRAVPDNGYRVQMVQGEDGTTRYIVYLSGTTGDRLFGEGQSWAANVPSARGQLDEKQAARLFKLIPKDAEVMLVGYSQGGMDAQNIAKSGKLNVTQIVTFGSPSRFDLDVPAVHVRAQDDLVPGMPAIAWRAGLPLFVASPPWLKAIELPALIDSHPYAYSDWGWGENNEIYKRDSDLPTDDWLENHANGYDSVSKQFDEDIKAGRAGSKLLHTNDFRGEVTKEVDIDLQGDTQAVGK